MKKGNVKLPPATASERSIRWRNRVLKAGGHRVEVLINNPEAIAALDALTITQGSKRSAIEFALCLAGKSLAKGNGETERHP